MKTLLTAIVIALVSQTANADEFRTWTEEATKRKIEAKIVEKDEKAGTVSLVLKSLNSVKLDVSKLSEDDQKYVKGWSKSIRPEDQLTVRVVASGQSRGGKRVEVDVKASKTDVVVSGGCDAGCHRLRKAVKAGERGLFQIEVHDKYTFTLNGADGNFIDQETALKKTGKTESR